MQRRSSTNHQPARHLPGWVALGVVYLVWGSTYLAIRVADESMPPFAMAAIRYLLAGLILSPVVLRRAPRPAASSAAVPSVPRVRAFSARQLAGCALVGVLMLMGGNGGVSWAERSVPSGLAALLVASVPLWMVAADRAITRAVPSTRTLFALGLGFTGVGVLAAPGGHHGSTSGVVVILIASLSWAVGSLLGRRVPQPRRALLATTLQMLAGGLALALLALASGELHQLHFDQVSVRSWLALAYLIGPGSILALTCYTVALRELPTSMVATYAYVNPIVAVLLGWAVLHEGFSGRTVLGGALVIGAVALVITAQRGLPRAHGTHAEPDTHRSDAVEP